MRDGRSFAEFQEGSLNTCPSYRWQRDEHAFSNKRGQSPSYTDRILWRSMPGVIQRTKLQFSQLSEQLGQANVQLEHSLKPQSWLHAGPLYSPLSFGQFKQQLQRSQVLKSQPQ